MLRKMAKPALKAFCRTKSFYVGAENLKIKSWNFGDVIKIEPGEERYP